jgi:hypothetical protein
MPSLETKLWQIEWITRGFHRQMNRQQIESGPQVVFDPGGRSSRLRPLIRSCEVAAPQELRPRNRA